ncbi:Fic family protein [Pseudidiomarina sp. E22-M8]|uniref:Fic family protein n=1 Tax=Pseudidiomarina sp. E22-M8 TaxID=3424768 RepID=UPI00403C1745
MNSLSCAYCMAVCLKGQALTRAVKRRGVGEARVTLVSLRKNCAVSQKHLIFKSYYEPNIVSIRLIEPLVSGPLTRPKVHFEAPPRKRIDKELKTFIAWFNRSQQDQALDPLLRAALTHVWFVTIHPFEDGNGRITRALTDRALTQADQQGIRLFAMSEAILAHRAEYYKRLEATHYQRVTSVSKATATRHLTELLEQQMLEKLPGGGRSTRYRLTRP